MHKITFSGTLPGLHCALQPLAGGGKLTASIPENPTLSPSALGETFNRFADFGL